MKLNLCLPTHCSVKSNHFVTNGYLKILLLQGLINQLDNLNAFFQSKHARSLLLNKEGQAPDPFKPNNNS